ncbi:VOC family protein [Patescibacteria group bacterium]|nr:VOC family protein [Patescibacteria group bacterium]
MPNRVAHFEIHADQPERCAKFYTDVFGWDIKKWEDPTGKMEYWMVMTGARDEVGGINGGLMRRYGTLSPDQQAANAFVCTVTVDDFDLYASKITENGGTVAMPKMSIAGMAWQGYFKDTEGNTFGLHQPDVNAK